MQLFRKKTMPSDDPAQDVFDRLYSRWASHALDTRTDPPSRERWDSAVLFLLQSTDPDRVRRYRRLDAEGPESLGADVYALLLRMPVYMPNRTAPVKTQPELREYEQGHLGSMRRMMEARGVEAKYDDIVAAFEEYRLQQRAKARKAQTSVVLIGCVAITSIIVMMLTVFLIIALQMSGR